MALLNNGNQENGHGGNGDLGGDNDNPNNPNPQPGQPVPVFSYQLSQEQLQQLLNGRGSTQRKVDSFDSGDPSEWLIWRERFLTIVSIARWDGLRQRSEAKVAMTGVAAAAVQDIPVDIGTDRDSATELLDAYEKRFLPPTASDAAWSTYCAATQAEAESIQMWHTRLRGLFRRAYPTESTANMENHRDLIQRFITGLSGATLRGHTQRMTFTTYSEALAAAQKAEASECDSHRRGGGARRVFALEPHERREGDVNPITAALQCWECLRTGHVRRQCPSLRSGAGSSYPVGRPRGRQSRPLKRGPARTAGTSASSRRPLRRLTGGSKRKIGRPSTRKALHNISRQLAALGDDASEGESEGDDEEYDDEEEEEVGAYAEGYGDGLEDSQAVDATEKESAATTSTN